MDGVGGPCDFSVSPSPFGLDFGTLDFGLGLDNNSLLEMTLEDKINLENGQKRIYFHLV